MGDDRLQRALGGSAAPARDPAFTLAVVRVAEAQNRPANVVGAMLRAGGFAAAAGSLAVPVLAWIAGNGAAAQSGAMAAAALFALVALMRPLASRATAMLRN